MLPQRLLLTIFKQFINNLTMTEKSAILQKTNINTYKKNPSFLFNDYINTSNNYGTSNFITKPTRVASSTCSLLNHILYNCSRKILDNDR